MDDMDLDPNCPFEEQFLTATTYAIQFDHHTTLGYSPTRDVCMSVNFEVYWETDQSKQTKLR